MAGGTAETTFQGRSEWSGTSPFGGIALTLMRLGSGLTYFDLGGEYSPGIGLSELGGDTTGTRNVTVTTGGIDRSYQREERRVDVQTGTVGERLRATAGFRHISQIDTLLQLGWGLNVTWRQATDTRTLASSYEVTEFFDADGDGTFSDGDVRSQARGQTRFLRETAMRDLDIRLPLAFTMLSEGNAGLEWRLGSELRYRNLWYRQTEELSGVVVPSGRSFSGSGESSPTRYGNALLPAGGVDEVREIGVTATLRAGAGYWFTRSAKIDFILSAEPAGEGFIDLSDPAFGVSALLVF